MLEHQEPAWALPRKQGERQKWGEQWRKACVHVAQRRPARQSLMKHQQAVLLTSLKPASAWTTVAERQLPALQHRQWRQQVSPWLLLHRQ